MMRVRFQKSDLAPAVALAQGITNDQSTIPMLSNILLTTDFDNQVTLMATDYETRAQIQIPAVVEARGATTLPARLFHDAISNIPDESEIVLEADREAIIRSGEIVLTLATMPAEDFPKLAAVEPTNTVELSESDLRRLFEQVNVAIPTRDPRKILLGAFIELEEDCIRGIGTDGKILANARIPMTSDALGGIKGSIIVPHKVVERLIYSLVGNGKVSVGWDDKMVSFAYRNVIVSSQQIDGRYPDWRRVVPNSFSSEMRFRRQDMMAAIKRASLVTDTQGNCVTLDFNNALVTVTAQSADRGKFRQQLPATGDVSLCIGFNYKFLLAALKAIEQDMVVVTANRPDTPAILFGEEEENLSYLIMPIKQNTPSKAPEPARNDEEDAEEEEQDEE